MKKLAVTAVITTSLLTTGCASIFSSKYETMSIQAQQNEKELVGVDCNLSNDKGSWQVTTPSDVKVRRSHRDLQVNCEKGQENFIPTSVSSSVSPLFFGNIIFGGIIGMVVDYTNGPGFRYPKEIIIDKNQGYIVPEKKKTRKGR